jgi:UDP-N-acetylmuramate--alanine ligase
MARHIHFVGVGGVSMYTLARLAMTNGATVSGSDRESNVRTERLKSLGATIYCGHNGVNAKDASLLVYSHAVNEDNPEIIYARDKGIPTVNRAEYMGAVMLDYKTRIGVSGTHGKSTTVAMLGAIFDHAMADPTVLSGADLPSGEPLAVGSRGMMIYEACEYRDSFLRFLPTVAIALNLELDHTDYFPDISSLKKSFARAMSRADRFAVISGDDKNLLSIMPKISADVISFGRGRNNMYRYEITDFRIGGFSFNLYKFDNKLGALELNIPGDFNVHNIMLEFGCEIECFGSAYRRFISFGSGGFTKATKLTFGKLRACNGKLCAVSGSLCIKFNMNQITVADVDNLAEHFC